MQSVLRETSKLMPILLFLIVAIVHLFTGVEDSAWLMCIAYALAVIAQGAYERSE